MDKAVSAMIARERPFNFVLQKDVIWVGWGHLVLWGILLFVGSCL